MGHIFEIHTKSLNTIVNQAKGSLAVAGGGGQILSTELDFVLFHFLHRCSITRIVLVRWAVFQDR